MARGMNWISPSVDIQRHAGFAIDEAFWVVPAISALNFALAVIDRMKTGQWGAVAGRFVDSVFFAGIALGIRGKSRVCAIAVLILYVLSRTYFWITTGPGNPVLRFLVARASFHGVRGTIAYHHFAPLPAGLPDIPDSFCAVAAESSGSDPKFEREK